MFWVRPSVMQAGVILRSACIHLSTCLKHSLGLSQFTRRIRKARPDLRLTVRFKSIHTMGADEFDYAKDRIWDLPHDISNEDKLELYKL